MSITEFLLARIAEDEAGARAVVGDRNAWDTPEWDASRWSPWRVLDECKAKRRIVELHESWPVLASTPMEFEPAPSTDPMQMTFRASQQIAWLTDREYRNRFGDEPPTAPMLRALASVFADHPDYDEAWRA